MMKTRGLIEDDGLDNNTPTPPLLLPITQPILERMNQTRTELDNNAISIKSSLEALPDEALRAIKDELSKGGCSEEKLMFSATVLLRDLQSIQCYIDRLNSVKGEVLSSFIYAFARQYSKSHGNELNFDLKSFQRDLDSLIEYRTRIRSQTVSNNAVIQPNSDNGQNARCCFM